MSLPTTVSESGIEASEVIKGVVSHLSNAIGGAIDRVVVDANEDAVGGDVQVSLEVQVSEIDRASEGRHRVLGPKEPTATMRYGERRVPMVETHEGKLMGLADGEAHYPFKERAFYLATRSFRPLDAEKWAYVFGAIQMVSPVAGLRP